MPATSTPDLEELTAEVLRLKREGVGSVPRLVLFGAGLHRSGEPPWTRAEIRSLLANFAALSTGPTPPLPVMIGLDHVEGGPAAGRVSRLWEEPGGVLACSFADMPRLYSEAIKRGLWFRVSAEIDGEPPEGLPGSGPCLVGVTLLGAQRPQLKWTSHLQDLVRYAERHPGQPAPRRYYCRRQSTRRISVFAEAVMDRAALEDQLRTLGFGDAELEALKALDDTAFMAFVNAVLARSAGAAPAGEGGTEAQEGMGREEMIAKILELDPARDRATLEAMTDEELKALLAQLEGGEFSEKGKGGDAGGSGTPNNGAANGDQAVTLQPQQMAAVVAEVEKRVGAQFAEQRRAMTQTVKRFNEQTAARERAERAARQAAERAEAEAVVEELKREGKVFPWEMDGGTPEDPQTTLVDEILAHDNARRIHAYSEAGKKSTLTDRQRFVRTLRKRPKVGGKYSEAIKQGKGGGGTSAIAALAETVRKETQARYAAANVTTDIPLHKRLGMLPPRHQR